MFNATHNTFTDFTSRCVPSVYWEGLDFDGSDVWVFSVCGDILSAHRTEEGAMEAMNAWKENQARSDT